MSKSINRWSNGSRRSQGKEAKESVGKLLEPETIILTKITLQHQAPTAQPSQTPPAIPRPLAPTPNSKTPHTSPSSSPLSISNRPPSPLPTTSPTATTPPFSPSSTKPHFFAISPYLRGCYCLLYCPRRCYEGFRIC